MLQLGSARLCGALVCAVASMLVVSGCAETAPQPAQTVFVTLPPTVESTPTPPPPSAAEKPAPVAEAPDAEAPDAPELEPNAPAAPVVPGPAVDLGATVGATGSVTAASDGALLTYTVAPQDVFFDIAQRFDLPQQQLLKMNPTIPELGTEIYIGQVINLDWTTTR